VTGLDVTAYNPKHDIDQPHIFDRVACFLAAIIARLLSRGGRPLAPRLGPTALQRGGTRKIP
jgi:hypothetical protein